MSYSKFNAKPTIVDSIRFASKAEARRYSELKDLERAGLIKGLVLQPRIKLEVNGKSVCTYVADFSYYENGKEVLEDVKGHPTDVYKLKRKLLLAIFPTVDHREIGPGASRKGRPEITGEVKEIFREANRRRA